MEVEMNPDLMSHQTNYEYVPFWENTRTVPHLPMQVCLPCNDRECKVSRPESVSAASLWGKSLPLWQISSYFMITGCLSLSICANYFRHETVCYKKEKPLSAVFRLVGNPWFFLCRRCRGSYRLVRCKSDPGDEHPVCRPSVGSSLKDLFRYYLAVSRPDPQSPSFTRKAGPSGVSAGFNYPFQAG